MRLSEVWTFLPPFLPLPLKQQNLSNDYIGKWCVLLFPGPMYNLFLTTLRQTLFYAEGNLSKSKFERSLVAKEGRCARKPTGSGSTTGLPNKACLICSLRGDITPKEILSQSINFIVDDRRVGNDRFPREG